MCYGRPSLSGEHLDLPNVLAFWVCRKPQQSQRAFFINHARLCSMSLVSPPLCFGYVSLGYRISSNPQQVPTNKGFQHLDAFRSMGVPSNISSGTGRGGCCPHHNYAFALLTLCSLCWFVMKLTFRRGTQICLMITPVTNFGFASMFLLAPELWDVAWVSVL